MTTYATWDQSLPANIRDTAAARPARPTLMIRGRQAAKSGRIGTPIIRRASDATPYGVRCCTPLERVVWDHEVAGSNPVAPISDGRYVFPKKSGQPYRPSGLRSILRRRGINGGYALRHTYAQFALESGVSLEVVQKHLGHKHISTTQTYAQVRDPQAVQAAQALPSLLQAPPPAEPARETGVGESREPQTANQSNPRRRSRAPARRKAAPRGASRRQSA